MKKIERYGVIALLFLVVTIATASMWDQGEGSKQDAVARADAGARTAGPAARGQGAAQPDSRVAQNGSRGTQPGARTSRPDARTQPSTPAADVRYAPQNAPSVGETDALAAARAAAREAAAQRLAEDRAATQLAGGAPSNSAASNSAPSNSAGGDPRSRRSAHDERREADSRGGIAPGLLAGDRDARSPRGEEALTQLREQSAGDSSSRRDNSAGASNERRSTASDNRTANAGSSSERARPASKGAGDGRVYVVEPGDTLGGIASRYLGSADKWRELAAANGITNPRAVAAGTKLRLDGIAGASAAGTAEASAEAATKTVAAASGNYTVRKGDTLGHIAQRELGSAKLWKEIQAANPGLDPARMIPGTQIIVPGKGRSAPSGPAARLAAATEPRRGGKKHFVR